MKTRLWTWLAAVALLAACSPREPEEGQASDEGRRETRAIEAADPLGYAGKPIRKKVDQALDTLDQRPQQLEQQLESPPGE